MTSDFVTLADFDGDGIVDLFDDEFLGTRFLPLAADGTRFSFVQFVQPDQADSPIRQ